MHGMTIGKKTTLGFGTVLVLLLLLNISTELGIRSIVNNANEVINGNQLDKTLAQKEVDHLMWAEQLSSFLTDDKITELTIQTDDHQCGFGKWLYGDGRLQAESLLPGLASMFKEIEKPHAELHRSAIAIKGVFKQSDPNLLTTIGGIKAAHLIWASKVKDALLNKSSGLSVETDPSKCGLGKWLGSEQATSLLTGDGEEIEGIFAAIPTSHNALHASANEINKLLVAGKFNQALDYFQTTTTPQLDSTLALLLKLEKYVQHDLDGMREANTIYVDQTVPALHEVQSLLKKIRTVTGDNIMSEDVIRVLKSI
ncbi:MAG: CZB domain-containing protein [Proteobacteria bacterium]|nr:CZB domain-containing protein [Pseudomonadota bacterium]MBU1687147.1 CZB domain-containing protein [Pseudomonadota bacterium]